jgi:hypothetical protein
MGHHAYGHHTPRASSELYDSMINGDGFSFEESFIRIPDSESFSAGNKSRKLTEADAPTREHEGAAPYAEVVKCPIDVISEAVVRDDNFIRMSVAEVDNCSVGEDAHEESFVEDDDICEKFDAFLDEHFKQEIWMFDVI